METETKVATEIVTAVPQKVTIKPARKNSFLPEGHDGSFRFSKTAEHLTIQIDRHTGVLKTGLSESDEKRLEAKMRLSPGTLSKYNKEYWTTFKVVVPQAGAVLKPAENSTDEIAYKVLLAHTEVANSISEFKSGDAPFARYIMHSEEEETETTNKEINLKLDAYKKLGEMSEEQMVAFLKVYGKNPGTGSSLDFIKAQIGKIVDSEPKVFLTTISDPFYKTRVFIKNCIGKGVIKESGGKYFRPGGEVIGYSMEQTIDFLNNRDNGEIVVILKGQLEASN